MTLRTFDQDSVQESTYARILLLGPSKAGKTTSCISTCPSPPYVINCDPEDALHYPAKVLRAKFNGANVSNRVEWAEACKDACNQAENGSNKVIIVDTLTLLCESLLADCETTLRGFDVWTARDKAVMQGVQELISAPAHLIFVAHLDPRSDGAAGVVPVIGGKQLAVKLPAFLSDWILFDIEPGRKPERCFVLGAQKNWGHSGRHIKGASLIEADIGLLLEQMGFEA